MFSTSAMALGRVNFPLGVHKTAQKVSVFIIDFIHLLVAEMASLYFHTNENE